MSDKTVEEIYQKKSQLEHILLRPDTYIGSVEMTSANLWILSGKEEKFEYKEIEYVPGFYKIFDEILVNAADNYHRDSSMNLIKVVIDAEKNFISVWNNGQGVPVQIHNEYNIYVPELIFGHLLTGSNYDDNQKKVVGGRNGYGAKLTNIFSKKFTVECGDSKNQKLFQKTWRHNMSTSSLADISAYKGKDYTCVSWESDLSRFGMTSFTPDVIGLLKKRAYDLAGIFNSKIKVFLNGEQIKIPNFSKYVDFYLSNPEETPKIYENSASNDRWEVLISLSDGQFQQVSFVNSICTSRGGSHVDYIANQIVEKVGEAVAKKNKAKLQIKPHQIKSNLWIFVNCLVENPTFDSQTKETLTLKVAQFGSKYQVSEKCISQLLKTDIVMQIISQAEARQNAKLNKTLSATKKSRLLGIAKLDDANDAGGRNAESCTLILTEGDSAKSLAMAGVEVVGRDKYGVFPLRGKLLNVREANAKQISENQEIQNVIKILGLQAGRKYEDLKSLRYGSIMIMADQDYDGSHIKGLVINFIHHFWPELIKINGFLKEFTTPILKATKGSQVVSFFTINDFKVWSANQNLKLWKIKYYKGLGTSTDKEAQEYFNNILLHRIDFKWVDNEDDDSIDLMFNKKRADDRKQWLQTYNPDNALDHSIKQLRYKDFSNKEMILFSIADNMRSIPSLCDGFKPGQRKILYACFKRNLKGELKVAQLSGYVAEHSAYHHGEISLAQTIIGMAQNFVGSNNINLLMPIGQFGTRNQGGKDHASGRYIFTSLNKVTRYIFPEPDDHLYNYLDDDGQKVEPEYYLPIIPMVLVNGADGIGTGWSTNLPCYNPRELVGLIKERLNGQPFREIQPWFKGFGGDIIENGKGFTVSGKWEVKEEEEVIEITELPIRKWTKDYKIYLEEMVMGEKDKDNAELDDIKEYHTNNRVHFLIQPKSGFLRKFISEGIDKHFKLTTSISTNNMVLFDSQGKLKKYASVKEILDEFFDLRLKFYEKRKDYLISKLNRDLAILSNKTRFILAVINEEIKLRNAKKKELCETLVQKGFVQMKNMPKILSTKAQEEVKKEEEAEEEEAQEDNLKPQSERNIDVAAKEFNYLLSLPLLSLTYEKVEALKKELEDKENELEVINRTSPQRMWNNDLEQFMIVLDEVEKQEEEDRINRPQAKGGQGLKKAKKAVIKKKKEGEEDEMKKKNEVEGGKKKREEEGGKKKEEEEGKKKKKEGKSTSTNLNELKEKGGGKEKEMDKEKKGGITSSGQKGLLERLENKDKQATSQSYKTGYDKFMEISQKSQLDQDLTKKRKPIDTIPDKKVKRKKIIDSDSEESFSIFEAAEIDEKEDKGRPQRNGAHKKYVMVDDSESELSVEYIPE